MYTTKAFIIKKEEYGEADLMLTVLSDHFGKIKVFARGVRKNGAKLRGHCEPISKSMITFVEGRNMYRLIHADVEEYYPAIRQDWAKLKTASHCLALADKHVFEDKDSRDIFRLFENTFSFLEQESCLGDALQKKVLIWFESNFLDCLGLLPDQAGEGFSTKYLQNFRAQPIEESVAASVGPADHLFTQNIFQKYLS